jgi:hypothetical protein
MSLKALIAVERIRRRILVLRGEKVMLDEDLAELYGVATKVLNQAVRRNRRRFPPDFMFPLTNQEVTALRSQSVTSKRARGGRRYLPNVFTEQGVAMLSSVLQSERAIEVNILIMRAFVQLRDFLASQDQFRRKLAALERKLTEHDEKLTFVFEAIRQLTAPPGKNPRRIGFRTDRKKG